MFVFISKRRYRELKEKQLLAAGALQRVESYEKMLNMQDRQITLQQELIEECDGREKKLIKALRDQQELIEQQKNRELKLVDALRTSLEFWSPVSPHEDRLKRNVLVILHESGEGEG